MQKSDLKILIVEDDVTVGKALEKGLKTNGFNPALAKSPEQAINSFKVQDFDLVLIDCMLPRKNGIDLAKELRSAYGNQFKIVFTSGVFKDRAFAKDALHGVKGLAFLLKPFDLKELTDVISNAFKDELDAQVGPVNEILLGKERSSKEVIEKASTIESLHAFQLPLLIMSLNICKFSGTLSLKDEKNEESSILFTQGQISKVLVNDQTSYFGVLLIEHGFTSAEEVKAGLDESNSKPIGQRLVDANAMSPHAINVIRVQQMLIRLSKIIQPLSYDTKLVAQEIEESDACIEYHHLLQITHDWAASKLTLGWLQSNYITWLDHPLKVLVDVKNVRLWENNELMRHTPKFFPKIAKEHTLAECVHMFRSEEEIFLRYIHFLLCAQIVCFQPKSNKKQSFKNQLLRSRKMLHEIEGKDHFQVLGLNEKARLKEISHAYMERAKTIHPDKLDPKAPTELKDLNQKLFALISAAHDTLTDPKKREVYSKNLRVGVSERLLKAESTLEIAIHELKKRDYKRAHPRLESILDLRSYRPEIAVYYLWASIKAFPEKRKDPDFISLCKDQLNQIPPEERHNHLYFYVKGLFYMLKKDYGKAQVNLQNASTIDPKFIEARAELARIDRRLERTKKANQDLSSVVGRFFGVKKGS